MTTPEHHTVLIVGGGPGGLPLAVVLGGWHPYYRSSASFTRRYQALAGYLDPVDGSLLELDFREVVRAGIQSVGKGQTEAAMSMGLKPAFVLNLVILPQALRVIIPPLTSQMLNLTKNSSLAVAIGYPDFVSVAGTTINQTGQAIEGVALMMIVYLTLSQLTSAFMNWYNKKMKLVER